jgi:hypothetical protein
MEFSIGRVISGTFGMIRQRFGGLVGIFVIYFGLLILYSVVGSMVIGVGLMGAMGALGGMEAADQANPLAVLGVLGVGTILGLIAFYVGYLLISMGQNASLCAYATPHRLLLLGDALAVGWRSALTMLGIMVLLIIAYVVVALIFVALAAASSSVGEFGGLLVVLIGFAALLYVGARLSVIFPVVAVEGQRNPLTAIARSWSLTSGHVIKIILLIVVYLLIMTGLVLVAFLPIAGTDLMSGGASAGTAIGGIFATFALFLVVMVLVSISYAALMSVLHAQLSGKDGEDYSGTFE